MLTSWKAYLGRRRPNPSSVDPADAFQFCPENIDSDPTTTKYSTQDRNVEDLERRRGSHLNGFVNNSKEERFSTEENVISGYRRSSMV